MLYVERRMTRRVLAFMLPIAAISIACKGGSAAKLEGRWHGIRATGVPSEQTSAANLFASAMIIEFHGDQVSVHTGSEKQSARFRVVRDEKTAVTIATDQDGPD